MSYGKYLRAAAELVDYPTIRPVPGLGKELTRDIKKGKPRGRHARKPAPVNVDATVEREVERLVELDRDRIFERERKVAAERDRAVLGVMVDRRAPGLSVSDLRAENRKYEHVRGLTRRR